MKHDTDALGQLLGAYFHQDWTSEFSTDEEAVEALLSAEPREVLREALREINLLMTRNLSEVDLREIVIEDVGCYYDPGHRGISYTEWLKLIYRKIAQHIE